MDDKSIECILGGYTLGHLISGLLYKRFHKTSAKQVWLRFIRRTMRLRLRALPKARGISDCFECSKHSVHKSSSPLPPPPKEKNACQIFLPKKIPESKISNLPKSFDHPCFLKSGVIPPSKVFPSNNVF